MSEFDRDNQNPGGNQNNNSNKVPEYSFWAEQISNNQINTNNNPSPNSWGANNNPYQYQHNADPYSSNVNPYSNNVNPYSNNVNPYSGNVDSYSNNMNAYPNNMNGFPIKEEGKKEKKKRGKGSKILRYLAKAVCFGVIAGISFLLIEQLFYVINPDVERVGIFTGTRKEEEEEKFHIGYTEEAQVKTALHSEVSNVIGSTVPSIVSITSVTNQPTEWFGQHFNEEYQGSGSGIIVGENENELLIATNNHVVAGTDVITVTFTDGAEANAVIKGTDATADLAVIAVDITSVKKATREAIKIAKLGSSDKVKVGEMAIAIGNALGYGQSVTVGYISAKDREVEVSDGYNNKTMVLLQTDAAINPGNSGGALLNTDGEVIGINTVKYASNEVEGMGYAIPISRAIPIINELMSREILKEEEQGFLGIVGNDVTEDVAEIYNMPIGVFINQIAEGGAAEKAGLMAGDIIVKVNDIEVTAITQLRDYVTSLRVGTDVEITYMRNTYGTYEKEKVTVTLGSNPELKKNEDKAADDN